MIELLIGLAVGIAIGCNVEIRLKAPAREAIAAAFPTWIGGSDGRA